MDVAGLRDAVPIKSVETQKARKPAFPPRRAFASAEATAGKQDKPHSKKTITSARTQTWFGCADHREVCAARGELLFHGDFTARLM